MTRLRCAWWLRPIRFRGLGEVEQAPAGAHGIIRRAGALSYDLAVLEFCPCARVAPGADWRERDITPDLWRRLGERPAVSGRRALRDELTARLCERGEWPCRGHSPRLAGLDRHAREVCAHCGSAVRLRLN
ncbi:MAG: hypothetical protein HYY25_05055 [Candidatus Wallbacteria bacterium]|nr:hypothetical protein [Candidatus Wallbacteria bacterium]